MQPQAILNSAAEVRNDRLLFCVKFARLGVMMGRSIDCMRRAQKSVFRPAAVLVLIQEA
jgi:hypothetical protein